MCSLSVLRIECGNYLNLLPLIHSNDKFGRILKISSGSSYMELNSRFKLWSELLCGKNAWREGRASSLLVPTLISMRFYLVRILSVSISEVRLERFTTNDISLHIVIFWMRSTFISSYSISILSSFVKNEERSGFSWRAVPYDTISLMECYDSSGDSVDRILLLKPIILTRFPL